MKILITTFIYICTLNFAHAAFHQPLSQNMQKEIGTAIEISKEFQKGMLSKKQANEILISIFSDFSHSDGKIASITQFVRKTIGIENPIIHVASEQRGWSGSEVYSIQSEITKEVQFFLKTFPFDSEHYLPEIFGLSFMNEVKDVDSSKICAIGQCFINNTRYFLILETPVNGISIQQYFSRVGQHQIGSKERTHALTELCEAVQACGLGLAKFHAYLPSKRKSLPQKAEERMAQDLNNAIEELIFQPKEGIEIEKLQAYADNILQKMKTHDHLIGLIYDDIKTIHTFYDIERKKFSLVNPHNLYLSFNQNGETQGLLIQDVCRYVLSLILNRFEYFLDKNQNVCRKELLTEEEVNMVKNMFELGYTQGGGILPNAIEKEYVLFQHNLFCIKNSRRNLPEPELTRIKDLISISLDNISSRLNKEV